MPSSPDHRLTIATRGRIIPDHANDSMLIELFDGEIHEVPDKKDPDKYQVIRFRQHNLHLENMERDFQESGRQARGDREMDLHDLKAAAAKEQEHQDQVGERVVELTGTFLTRHFQPLNPAQRHIALGTTTAPAPGPELDAFLQRKFKATRAGIERMVEQTRHQGRLLESYEARENRYNVEYHKKFAIPFACVIFALLGIPMAVTTSRSGKGVSVSLALAVYLVYYLFLMGGEKLADRGKLDPFIAMWAANFLLLGLGVPMFIKAARESSLLSITRRSQPMQAADQPAASIPQES